MIVADTNLLAYFVLKGANTPTAMLARARDRKWIAPALIRYELMNVLVQARKRSELDRDTAARIYRRAMTLIEIETVQPDPLDILNLVESSNCSPYDMQFIWLAQEHDIQLITADRELAQAFPEVATLITDFVKR